MANQFGSTGPVSGLKPRYLSDGTTIVSGERQECVNGASNLGTHITVQYIESKDKFELKTVETGHTLYFDSSRAVKRFVNAIYEGEVTERNVDWLDDLSGEAENYEAGIKAQAVEPVRADADIIYYPWAGAFPWHAALRLLCESGDTVDTLTGTHASLGDAATWVTNAVRTLHLDGARINIHSKGQGRVAVQPEEWTTEEILRRES